MLEKQPKINSDIHTYIKKDGAVKGNSIARLFVYLQYLCSYYLGTDKMIKKSCITVKKLSLYCVVVILHSTKNSKYVLD